MEQIKSLATSKAQKAIESGVEITPEVTMKIVNESTDEAINALSKEEQVQLQNDIKALPKPESAPPEQMMKDIEEFGRVPDPTQIAPEAPKLTPEASLMAEAKKYKSAEEFVKSQGTPVYHGTSAKFDKFDNAKIGSTQGFNEPGFSFTDTIDGAKVYSSTYPQKSKFKWTETDKLNAEKANVIEAYFKKDDAITLTDLNKLYEQGKIKTKPKTEGLFRPESVADNNREAIKEAFEATDKNVFKATMEGQTNYIVKDASLIKTKSQLTDIWNKAQEAQIAEAPTAPTPKEVTTEAVVEKGVSKIAKSIEAKAIEENLTKGFGELAGYDKITLKDQSARAEKLINEDIETARKVIRGEQVIPDGLNPVALVTGMELHIKTITDKATRGELAYELANSELISESSVAGQTLRLASERTQDSATNAINELRRFKEERAKKRGKTAEKTKKDLKKEIEKINLPKEDLSWNRFLDTIKC
jgi:hypothetical protein